MLWLHETHHVIGKRENEFEALYRDAWMPQLAEIDGVRLLYFLKHAHGSGASYRVVTISGLRDASCWAGLQASVDQGSLADTSQQLDQTRHDVVGKLLAPLPWARESQVQLGEVPTDGRSHELSVFMEDTVWPHANLLERYVEAAGAHYAAEIGQREKEGHAILSIQGAYRTAFGAGRRREILLWQKVTRPEALAALIANEVPEKYKRPGTWMNDALELRDHWESRLLRTTEWSPLY